MNETEMRTVRNEYERNRKELKKGRERIQSREGEGRGAGGNEVERGGLRERSGRGVRMKGNERR